jgi:predicted ATPase
VGRQAEVAELVDLVGAHRLVTLTGAGGVGKTRLAVQVAAELAGAFAAGVRLVELAPVGTPTRWPTPWPPPWG